MTEAVIPMLGAPTASGKSAAALRLAERFELEIVSADAMQVYRGMDIGTAKPSRAERARVPHHLVDVVDPDEAFSVARFVSLAESVIAGILERGRLPLVVGGTGYYLRSLAHGLPTAPAADPEVQAPLWRRLERDGLDPLLAELAAASLADAERSQRNPRRVVRALEVLRRTGRPPSDFPRTPPGYRYTKAILSPDPADLAPRIAARVDAMFAAGLVTEVAGLLERYPHQLTATQAIGYKEIVAFLHGETTLDQARSEIVSATVRYAKRQRTWFRKETNVARRYEAPASEVLEELAEWIYRERA